MKGMLLLDQTLFSSDRRLYRFDAFDHGPMSGDVYRDVLKIGQLIDVTPMAPGSYRRTYVPNEAGRQVCVRIEQSKPPEQLQAVRDAAAYVTSRGLDEILDRISQEYPFFAVSTAPLAPTGD
ncbi:MAG: hypothetical protein U0Z70_23080 [Thermomicrobiales bacterium]